MWKPSSHLYNSKAVISVCVGTYQAIDSDAGDDSPLEGPQDEHGKGHDDPDLPRFVLCRNTRVCVSVKAPVMSEQQCCVTPVTLVAAPVGM